MHDYYFINDLLKLNKAVILSTGVSDIKDIDLVLNLISKQRNKKSEYYIGDHYILRILIN